MTPCSVPGNPCKSHSDQVKGAAWIRRDTLPPPATIFHMSTKAPVLAGPGRQALACLSPEPASSRQAASLGKLGTSAIVRLLPPVPAMSPAEEQANRKALMRVSGCPWRRSEADRYFLPVADKRVSISHESLGSAFPGGCYGLASPPGVQCDSTVMGGAHVAGKTLQTKDTTSEAHPSASSFD